MDNQDNIKNSRLGWTTISGLGKSRFIRSFNLWFILIPVLAKITEPFPTTVDLGIFSPSLYISLGLPFSLRVLYLASLFFTLANIIYVLFCPAIIKNYRTFSDYREQEGSFEGLKQLFEPLLQRSTETYRKVLLHDFYDHVNTTTSAPARDFPLNAVRSEFDICKVSNELLAEAYSNIKSAYNEERAVAQWASLVFYVSGFVCLTYLLIQNVQYVFGI